MELEDEIFLIFTDTSNHICWHNLRFTKSISSSGYAALQDPKFREEYLNGTANYAPFVPNNARSGGFISLFTMHATSQYAVEYDAEYLRYHEFSTLQSRMSAVYAFRSEDDCQKANQIYKWDLNTLRRFRLIRDQFTRVHRANMEVVSLMRHAYPQASWSREDRDNIWRHYWSGAGSMKVQIPTIQDDKPSRKWIESGEIWEYLIEGRLELVEETP